MKLWILLIAAATTVLWACQPVQQTRAETRSWPTPVVPGALVQPRGCPSPTLDVDLHACVGVLPADYGLSALHPLEWGKQVGRLGMGRLRCSNGALPIERLLGEGGKAGPTTSPRQLQDGQTADGKDELLDLWELQCPGQPPLHLYVNTTRCGTACLPAGLAWSDVHAESAIASAEVAAAQGNRALALEWARLAAQQAPRDQAVQAGVANVTMNFEQWAEMAAATEAILSMDPADPMARIGLAMAKVRQTPGKTGQNPAMAPRSVPLGPTPSHHLLHLNAEDDRVLAAIAGLDNTPGIQDGDLKSPSFDALAAQLSPLVAAKAGSERSWLKSALRLAQGWQALLDVAQSGEKRDETWVEIDLDSDGVLGTAVRSRGPVNLARRLLFEPRATLAEIEADLDTHIGALPQAWAPSRIRSEISLPLLLTAATALMEVEIRHPSLSPRESVVIAGNAWTAGYFEVVSLLRLRRLWLESPVAAERQAAQDFVLAVQGQADLALNVISRPQGIQAVAAQTPSMMRGVGVLREVTAMLHELTGQPPPPTVPVPSLDAHPDPGALRRLPSLKEPPDRKAPTAPNRRR